MARTNEAFMIAAQANAEGGPPPLVVGEPGTAKTSAIYALAKALNRKCCTLIASIRDPSDFGGYPYPAKIDAKAEDGMAMRFLPPQWAAEIKNCCKSKSIVFFDEITTCAPSTQAALLRVIAEKVVGELALPADTIFLAACNPPEQAANGIELEPPMANRFAHFKWECPRDAIMRGWQNGMEFPDPEFPMLPEDWRKFIGPVGGMMAAFIRHRPALLESFPSDRSRQAGPWPSPRSWTNAITLKAAGKAVGADPGILHQMVSGCIGEPAALEYATWEESLDLPDPEVVLAAFISAAKTGQEAAYNHPNRPDKVIAMLSAVSQAVIGNNNPERWEAGMAVIERASRKDMDVALAAAGPLARAMKDSKGGKFPAEFLTRLYPKIQRALQGT